MVSKAEGSELTNRDGLAKMDRDGLGLGRSDLDFGFFRDNGAFDEEFFGTLVDDVSKSEGLELTAIDGIAEMN